MHANSMPLATIFIKGFDETRPQGNETLVLIGTRILRDKLPFAKL